MDRRSFLLGSGATLLAGNVADARGDDGLLFWDKFDRPDTEVGDLGMPTLGQPYDLRGPYIDRFPLPKSLTGRISGNLFAAPPASVVYAAQRLEQVPRRMRASISFVDTGQKGAPGSSAALLVSHDDKLVSDVPMHVIVNRSVSKWQRRVNGGAFNQLGAIDGLNLPADGTVIKVEAVVNPDDTWSLRVAGRETSGRDRGLYESMSRLCAWEIYQPDVTNDTVRFHQVSAWAS